MSLVFEEQRLRALFVTLGSYISEFRAALRDVRVKAGVAFPDPFGLLGEDAAEVGFTKVENGIFDMFLDSGVGFPDVRYKDLTTIHLIDEQFMKDWPPIRVWFFDPAVIGSAALPQFPQIRRRIRDVDGGPRTIRIKAAELP